MRRTNQNTCLLMSVFLLAMVCTAAGQIIYVDAGATGANNGSSWADAYNYLQDALAAAASGYEIWVAEGTYKPDQGGGNTPGDRGATFQLINGVTLKGGYAGAGEPDPDACDITAYETILSGDLNGDDGPNFANNGENSYHVVTGSGTDQSAVLDGFTITAGNANTGSYPHYCGGGMFNCQGNPTITQCTFRGNSADFGGGMTNDRSNPTLINCAFTDNSAHHYCGGMYNHYSSGPTLTNCTFSGNSAGTWGGGMFNDRSNPTLANCTFSENSAWCGGGMYNRYSSGPTLTTCTFNGNSASSNGGGMANEYSNPTLINCTFSRNSAKGSSGGMHNWKSSPTLTNCAFSGNSADQGGGMENDTTSNPTLTNCTFSYNSAKNSGGMHNDTSSPTLTNCTFSENTSIYEGGGIHISMSSPMLTNCTFIGNSSDLGGGMFNSEGSPTLINCVFSGNSADFGGGVYNERSGSALTNCILWGNSAPIGPEIYNVSSTPKVTYSDIAGGYTGTGNINADPLFVDADLRLSPGSPCIDAGDNSSVAVATDLDGNPRIFNGIVDMGAYESQIPSNRPPLANAGLDQTVEQDSYAGASVNLDGSSSYDPDGDSLTYSWAWDGGSASGVSPTVVLSLGTTIVTLLVNDGQVDSDPDDVVITVEDTTPPTINSISASPDVLWPLWPPNHKMVEVAVAVDATDICDSAPFSYILGVTTNEPINGPGDGNSEPDWELFTDEPLVVMLRAERAGVGTGRVYTIFVECMDASGNITTGTVDVTVPHDQGK